jgi:hypothetical protein
VDDIALALVSVPNPVPSAGHFNRALLGTFSQAPKSEGQQAMYKAREEGRDSYDLTNDEIEAVEQMASMASAWRQSIDPDDGFLRIYVD